MGLSAQTTPRPLYPGERDPASIVLYMDLGWPQGVSERARNISPPPGFDPRTVQPVAWWYTDYDILFYYYQLDTQISYSFTQIT